MQPPGDWLQAGQFDDLGSLHGGDLLRTTEAGFIPQKSCQAALLVAATEAPDGGPVRLHPRGNRVDQFAGGDGQDDAGMLDLEPGQVPAPSDGLEDRKIIGSDGQGTRLSAAHGTTLMPEQAPYSSIPVAPNLLHYFVPIPLALESWCAK